jgi:hypothetical protein
MFALFIRWTGEATCPLSSGGVPPHAGPISFASVEGGTR